METLTQLSGCNTHSYRNRRFNFFVLSFYPTHHDDPNALRGACSSCYCTSYSSLLVLHPSTFTLQISLHYILSFTHEGYGRAASFSNLKNKIIGSQSHLPPYKEPVPDKYYVGQNNTSPQRKANAAFVILGTKHFHKHNYWIAQLFF
jgi:hypothetical protein